MEKQFSDVIEEVRGNLEMNGNKLASVHTVTVMMALVSLGYKVMDKEGK